MDINREMFRKLQLNCRYTKVSFRTYPFNYKLLLSVDHTKLEGIKYGGSYVRERG